MFWFVVEDLSSGGRVSTYVLPHGKVRIVVLSTSSLRTFTCVECKPEINSFLVLAMNKMTSNPGLNWAPYQHLET